MGLQQVLKLLAASLVRNLLWDFCLLMQVCKANMQIQQLNLKHVHPELSLNNFSPTESTWTMYVQGKGMTSTGVED